jgi:hypothetical protein
MKPQRIFSVVLAPILFTSIVTLPFVARAQQRRDHFRGDPSVITLGVQGQLASHSSYIW